MVSGRSTQELKGDPQPLNVDELSLRSLSRMFAGRRKIGALMVATAALGAGWLMGENSRQDENLLLEDRVAAVSTVTGVAEGSIVLPSGTDILYTPSNKAGGDNQRQVIAEVPNSEKWQVKQPLVSKKDGWIAVQLGSQPSIGFSANREETAQSLGWVQVDDSEMQALKSQGVLKGSIGEDGRFVPDSGKPLGPLANMKQFDQDQVIPG